jgi:hypothetical protein
MGGFVTILASFAVIGYAVYVLHAVFTRANLNVESAVVDFDDTLFTMTM